MPDSEEKLCRLVSGRVCKRRMFIGDVSRSKVMRCLRYGNWGLMHVRLNGKPLV